MKYYEIDFKINAPEDLMQDASDVLAAMSAEAGLETFEETSYGIKGYAQQSLFDRDYLNTLIIDFPFNDVEITYAVNEAEDKDWNETWENEGFAPIIVGEKCVIHDGRHLPEKVYPLSIEIDAKMAFGTGTHETTRMIVTELTNMIMDGKRLLDCGCGTGILSIVALMCGASHAIGYDIDEWSVDNARHNAIINRVDEKFESVLGDATVIPSIEGLFDIVVANINRNILLADMESFTNKLKHNGILILSGFYTNDEPLLIDKAQSLGLSLEAKNADNNWSCLLFKANTL